MHIGFLTPEYPHPLSTSSGGLGTSIENLVTTLAKKGFKVTVFIYGQKENKEITEAGVHFHFIKEQKYILLGWYLHRKFLQRYLNKIVYAEKLDIIEAPDWTGITAFMSLNCPLIIRFHGSDSYFCSIENRPQKKKNFWFEKLALKGADHLLSVSEFTAKKTKEIFKLKKEIKVIPNSIDVEIFRPINAESIPNTILYFGSIIRKKGVLELAHIFNRIHNLDSDIRLIMAGKDVVDIISGGSTFKLMVEILTPSARKQLLWKDNLPYSEIIPEIQKATIVVLPSFAEALPMTWLEAMAMEKALVTSNIGWAKEIMIDGKTGFMVHPQDHKIYADRILKLLQEPELRKKMGRAARSQVKKHFSTQVVVEKNINFYLSLNQ